MFKKFISTLKNWFNQSINHVADNYDFTLEGTTNSIVNEINDTQNANETIDFNNQSINQPSKPKNIYPMLDLNLEYIKVRFNSMINSDIIIREFNLTARNKVYKAFIVFIDGMINQDSMNNYILKPLMLKNNANSY